MFRNTARLYGCACQASHAKVGRKATASAARGRRRAHSAPSSRTANLDACPVCAEAPTAQPSRIPRRLRIPACAAAPVAPASDPRSRRFQRHRAADRRPSHRVSPPASAPRWLTRDRGRRAGFTRHRFVDVLKVHPREEGILRLRRHADAVLRRGSAGELSAAPKPTALMIDTRHPGCLLRGGEGGKPVGRTPQTDRVGNPEVARAGP